MTCIQIGEIQAVLSWSSGRPGDDSWHVEFSFTPQDYLACGGDLPIQSAVKFFSSVNREQFGRFLGLLEAEHIQFVDLQCKYIDGLEHSSRDLKTALDEAYALLKKSSESGVRAEFTSQRNELYGALVERDGEDCAMCGSTENLSIDHDVPVSKGGSNELSNLVILCKSCNSRKHNGPYLRALPNA